MSRALKLLLIGAAFFSSVLSAHEYPPEAKSTRTVVTVHVVWLPSFDATNHFCAFLNDQRVDPDSKEMIIGCYESHTNTIYAVEPISFNDNLHLAILGHEFWHALGALHPE